MNKEKITRNFYKLMFKAKKQAPEVFIVAGIGGAVVSTVLACKATLKVHDVLDEAKDNIDKVHQTLDNPEYAEKYTKEDSTKDLMIIYAKTGKDLAKLYGPSIIVGVLSLTSIIYSHDLLKKRNVALAAAYATVDKSFKQYRQRVVERFGDTVDKSLRFNSNETTICKETDKDENDQTKDKEAKIDCSHISPSEYAIIFDEGNMGWEPDYIYNMAHLRAQQSFANNKLRTQGYLFLNDVYDMVGHSRTKAGQVVGWAYDPKNDNLQNVIDFGLDAFEKYYEMECAEEASYKPAGILLDLKPDGNILDLL